jgi:hypothetical protein
MLFAHSQQQTQESQLTVLNNSIEDGISFSTLYNEITRRVTPTVAQNISAPIAFVTLLHTVNEKVSLLSLPIKLIMSIPFFNHSQG